MRNRNYLTCTCNGVGVNFIYYLSPPPFYFQCTTNWKFHFTLLISGSGTMCSYLVQRWADYSLERQKRWTEQNSGSWMELKLTDDFWNFELPSWSKALTIFIWQMNLPRLLDCCLNLLYKNWPLCSMTLSWVLLMRCAKLGSSDHRWQRNASRWRTSFWNPVVDRLLFELHVNVHAKASEL